MKRRPATALIIVADQNPAALLRRRFFFPLLLFFAGFLFFRQRPLRLCLGRLVFWSLTRLCTRWTVGPLLIRLPLSSLVGLLLICLPLAGLIRLLFIRLPLAGLIGLLFVRLPLASLIGLLLIGLPLAGLIGLLFVRLTLPILIRLLLSCLLLASLLLLLLSCLLFASLVRLLLLTRLVGLLLSRRRSVVATGLRPLARRIRLWRVSGFVRRVRWRRIGRLPGVTHSWLAARAVGVRAVGVRRRGFSRRRLLDLGPLCRNVRRTQRFDFVPRERLAGVRRERLLLLCKRHRRRGRRCLRYHGPLGNGCWWLSYPIGGRGCRSEYSFCCSGHRCPPVDGRRGNLLLIHDNHGSGHRLRAGKCALRNCGYSAPHRPVNVGDVSDVIIRDLRVVDVCDGRGRDGRVAHIDAVHVTTADVIRRHINFPRAQREPPHIHAEPASASAANKHH